MGGAKNLHNTQKSCLRGPLNGLRQTDVIGVLAGVTVVVNPLLRVPTERLLEPFALTATVDIFGGLEALQCPCRAKIDGR